MVGKPHAQDFKPEGFGVEGPSITNDLMGGSPYDQVPLVPLNGDGPGSNVPIRVNTETMRIFAANLRQFIQPLTTVATNLEDVTIAPGWFFEAGELKMRVQGAASSSGQTTTGGIAPRTARFARDLANAFEETATALEELIAKYGTVEELNGVTGQRLGELFDDAKEPLQNAAYDTPAGTT